MSAIDEKIAGLREITSEWLFMEYYSHSDAIMWKINNEFTCFARSTVVLCKVSEGIELALDNAIEYLTKAKNNQL